MTRLLTFAVLTLFAVSSSALAADPVVRDHRTNKTTSGPVVRDHRKPTVVAPATGPTIRDHRTTTTSKDLAGPVIRDHRKPTVVAPTTSGPVVRDHRTTTPYVVPGNSGAVVRDHRNGAGSSGGVTVTSTPRPRKPKDNILIGNQPTVGGVVKGIGSTISDAGSAVMDGLGAVGNVFGIGYGSITPANPPKRPQVIDHRR